MIPDLTPACPACTAAMEPTDAFCEGCGASVASIRDASLAHFEHDLGAVAAVSDRGRVRARNEDAFFAGVLDGTAAAVVCDGISASANSQAAAHVAAQAAGSVLMTRAAGPPHDPADAVCDALTAADGAVRALATGRALADPPSTTIVAAVWDGAEVAVGWAGDSRAYWIDATGARALTKDHAWDGTHVVTRWLGVDSAEGAHPVVSFRPRSAGRLVLCSDGLWGHLTEEDIAQVGRDPLRTESAGAVTRALVAEALARGGHDNVTVAIADVQPSTVRARKEEP